MELIWYGHVERVSEERLSNRIYGVGEDGTRGRGRPRTRWLEGAGEMLNDKGLAVQQAKTCMQEREK